MSSFFSKLPFAYVDHVAVTTRDLERTLADWLSLPGARLRRGPMVNDVQRVRVAFVDVPPTGTVELLSPLDDRSPIARHLDVAPGAYHFCFGVHDIDLATRLAREDGAVVTVAPTADPAFDGRRVAFVVHPAHGLLEFVETMHSATSADRGPETTVSAPARTARQTTTAWQQRLEEIFARVFPRARGRYEGMGITDGWDSFGAIELAMALEAALDVSFTTAELAKLTSREAVETLLAAKLGS
jgi:catechol 2,3-dioxygenase-like lactoylglutathione lyase family enzyme